MSDKDTTSTSSASTATSTTTGYEGVPGILFVGSQIQHKTTPESLLHAWYDSHFTDLLSLPHTSNLCLRYRNLDPTADLYANPHQPSRLSMTPNQVRTAIADFPWMYLAVNKVDDLAWLVSEEFRGLRLTSPLLPRRDDGSEGGAFDVWFAALRVYEKVEQVVRRPMKEEGGRGNWLVTVQLDGLEFVDEVKRVYGEREACRSVMVCRVAEGLSEYPEIGPLPVGLVVMEFEGERAPEKEEVGGGEGVVRVDVWECFVEMGDKSLEL